MACSHDDGGARSLWSSWKSGLLEVSLALLALRFCLYFRYVYVYVYVYAVVMAVSVCYCLVVTFWIDDDVDPVTMTCSDDAVVLKR